MSDYRLMVKLADKTVWEVGGSVTDNLRAAYYCSRVETRASPDEEE
jgi:hypothetical protein